MSKPSIVGELALYGLSALGTPPPDPRSDTVYRSGISWQRGFARAIKLGVMYRANGVVVIIPQVGGLFAAYPNSNWEIYGFDLSAKDPCYCPRGPHPKTSAFLMTCYWLDGAELVSQYVMHDQAFLYEWKRPDGEIFVIAWSAEGQVVPLRVPADFVVTDIFGTQLHSPVLGEEPLLFHQNGSSGPVSALKTIVSSLGHSEP